ncbi:MAG TPA: phosphoribosylamine--glycine ligase, partial [Microbacterium sp.]|nr:phosphoribosylamine--glycine ligase [Microbacterium sp.]
PQVGRAITGTDAASSVDGVRLAHAATAAGPEGLLATGGRVLNVVATGEDFTQARSRAYDALSKITLEGGQFRTDIAARVS